MLRAIENYYRVPIAKGDITSTISIDEKKGIYAFYCETEKRIHTFLFDRDEWEVDGALKWIKNSEEDIEGILENSKEINFKNEEVKSMNKIKKRLDFELKNFDDEKLSFDAIASTSDIDRDGDTLQASGWVLKNYKKNPVILWGHNANLLPIGRAENVRKVDDKLTFSPVFTPADINPLGEQIYRMFKANFLNAFSVRFDPIEWEERTAEEGEDKRRIGRNYKKQELLEISPVNVPSLPGALASRDFQDMVLKGYMAENSGVIDDPAEREKFLKGITLPEEQKSDTEKIWEDTENEIRYRVKPPGQFQEGSFRRITIKRDKPRVFAIIGRPTGETTTKVQALRFPKEDDWTLAQAKQWVKDHPEIKKDYIYCENSCWKFANKDELNEGGIVINQGLAILGTEGIETLIPFKSGRVLSEKNRSLVKTTIEQIDKVTASLNQLYEATEPKDPVDDSDKDIEALHKDLEAINKENEVDGILQRGQTLLNEGGE